MIENIYIFFKNIFIYKITWLFYVAQVEEHSHTLLWFESQHILGPRTLLGVTLGIPLSRFWAWPWATRHPSTARSVLQNNRENRTETEPALVEMVFPQHYLMS